LVRNPRLGNDLRRFDIDLAGSCRTIRDSMTATAPITRPRDRRPDAARRAALSRAVAPVPARFTLMSRAALRTRVERAVAAHRP